MVDLTLISGFSNLLLVFIENWGFGASQSGDSVTSIPAGFVVVVFSNITLAKTHELLFIYNFPMMFHQNDTKLSSTRGIIGQTGILDPIKFWWVP